MHMAFGMDAARAYIGNVRWQFATTMPEWPHEYTVKAWRPELSAEFEAFSRLIAQQGFVEPWPPAPARAIYHNRYLVIGDHKYWAMGAHGDLDPPEQMTVINRAAPT
jgi:hypothetical protein